MKKILLFSLTLILSSQIALAQESCFKIKTYAPKCWQDGWKSGWIDGHNMVNSAQRWTPPNAPTATMRPANFQGSEYARGHAAGWEAGVKNGKGKK